VAAGAVGSALDVGLRLDAVTETVGDGEWKLGA
jgi:hypothetical protein